MLYWLRFQKRLKQINQAIEIFLEAIAQEIQKILTKSRLKIWEVLSS
ncbi:putative phage related exonuclease [Bartonella grahamii as4aup]|uniref:Phage related exonuclease n=1 Tax=Bartonella grahamii (strain as4aup) TaxID=634504 RepID=C6ABT1_BARGA|nr:putative phage related exonuclease [Bartonella grahamii as4aup]